VRFLVDRCAGRRVALWLREKGYDVAEVVGPDPGDLEILERAGQENRILITLDKHFVQLLFRRSQAYPGLIRLPDVPAAHRILLLERILSSHSEDLSRGAVIAVRGERIRVSLRRRDEEE
jgi:predicted nuclease of predicted toxin-antitoxin system